MKIPLLTLKKHYYELTDHMFELLPTCRLDTDAHTVDDEYYRDVELSIEASLLYIGV